MLICPTVCLKVKQECTLIAMKVQQDGHKCHHSITEKRKQ